MQQPIAMGNNVLLIVRLMPPEALTAVGYPSKVKIIYIKFDQGISPFLKQSNVSPYYTKNADALHLLSRGCASLTKRFLCNRKQFPHITQKRMQRLYIPFRAGVHP
jgi:hypothetical protein